MSKYEIAETLKRTREKLGLKQQDVADYLNTTVQKVSSFETARTRIDIDTLVLLCSLYKLDINYVTGNKVVASALSPDESELLSCYRKLSREGQEELIKRAQELLDLGYIKTNSDGMVESSL